jgi:hypothetical protein
VVLARGFLDGAEVASQFFQSSSEVWRTESANSSFATAIDVLRFELVEYNHSALIFDNLVFELVPNQAHTYCWRLACRHWCGFGVVESFEVTA